MSLALTVKENIVRKHAYLRVFHNILKGKPHWVSERGELRPETLFILRGWGNDSGGGERPLQKLEYRVGPRTLAAFAVASVMEGRKLEVVSPPSFLLLVLSKDIWMSGFCINHIRYSPPVGWRAVVPDASDW
ncbi:jg27505 [Pararge aegeria aegeria]|uniref:Jg27505 protein n=1 Tax=Pararge aegeria aegeria TaxID=348720 RepID=A0A8S4SDU5_9NEOP|nr:jg27505 [Pararge aegeria aegeria]